MKEKNIKQAMNNGSLIVSNIYSKGSKRIIIDFQPRFFNNGYKSQSFWIDRNNFERNYPNTYNSF